MNCYDCDTLKGIDRSAVAICLGCGAALCAEHTCTTPRTVHRVNGTGVATLPLAARRHLCGTCSRAEDSR
ncbi:DUF2180 family protein [Streptacidiphilus sp. 4-A2]|nr:DUF2180 family protein [Streptacidiphilus sp. 4-A2]